MKYQSLTIRSAINKLNRTYFLPALQREFVWTEQQIVRLFDSVMRGYPISSFLFWQPGCAAATKWASYKFLEEVRDGGSHNDLANLSGTSQATFVLDGQQRLTAFNIGLRGIYVSKEKGKHKSNLKAWKNKKLYLDLLYKNRPNEIGDDNETDAHYRFAFLENPPTPTKSSCWFEVGSILKHSENTSLAKCIRKVIQTLPNPASKNAIETVRSTLKRLRQAICVDHVIFYYSETQPDYERVLDIFIRANEAGTKLTKSDLLLSTITSNWQSEDARKEIHDFVDHLNKGVHIQNDFQKDFVIKACFVLCDLPVKLKVANFTRVNLKKIESQWPRVKQVLEDCVRLVNRFGLNQENLTSANALIPIAYYLFQRLGETLMGDSTWEARNVKKIHRWLIMALVNRVFSGSSDTMLSMVRDVLRQHTGKRDDFPIEKLNAAMVTRRRMLRFGDDAINNILERNYEDNEAFLVLTLLYDDVFWGLTPHHKDHIFPKSHFSRDSLNNAGVPLELHEEYSILKDRIGNLQLLSANENQKKLAKPFDNWVKTRDKSFYKKQLIPTNSNLYSLMQFKKFLDKREQMIRSKLKKLFSV